jgi:hypothetical protein
MADIRSFRKGIENPDPAICANVIIGLIRVTIICWISSPGDWNGTSWNRAGSASE